MIILITVKHNITKDLIQSLLKNNALIEFNSMHNSFRIKNVIQWIYILEKESYLLSFKNSIEEIIIHKDNIEQLCIAEQ